MRKRRVLVLAVAAALASGCETWNQQLEDGYQFGDATKTVMIEAKALHKLGCEGRVGTARASLLQLYRSFLNPKYPAGGVCDDPLGVAEYAANRVKGGNR